MAQMPGDKTKGRDNRLKQRKHRGSDRPNSFEFTPMEIPDVILVHPNHKFYDERGHFLENYKRSEFVAAGITEHFVQENISVSSPLVLRGVHYQRDPKAQGKLVSCLHGQIWDFFVDIREDSPTFKKWGFHVLCGKRNDQLYIPPGFAHGFFALNNAKVMYKCTEEYSKEHDAGFRWDDKEIGIEFPPFDQMKFQVSPKDQKLPSFRDRDKIFVS